MCSAAGSQGYMVLYALVFWGCMFMGFRFGYKQNQDTLVPSPPQASLSVLKNYPEMSQKSQSSFLQKESWDQWLGPFSCQTAAVTNQLQISLGKIFCQQCWILSDKHSMSPYLQVWIQDFGSQGQARKYRPVPLNLNISRILIQPKKWGRLALTPTLVFFPNSVWLLELQVDPA